MVGGMVLVEREDVNFFSERVKDASGIQLWCKGLSKMEVYEKFTAD